MLVDSLDTCKKWAQSHSKTPTFKSMCISTLKCKSKLIFNSVSARLWSAGQKLKFAVVRQERDLRKHNFLAE